jgi:peptide/nickel transport system substrate-binding protein
VRVFGNGLGHRSGILRIGLNPTGSGNDDPDQQFYENHSRDSERNDTGYCDPELQKLSDPQAA